MALNHEQKAVVERLVRFVTVEKELGITLSAPGGCGKTYCIMYAVQEMLDAGLKVLLTAPTNKAVKQLEKAAREHGLSMNNVSFTTVHSALGLAMLPDEDKKYAARVGRGLLKIFDVMVIDECSMLSKIALTKYILPDAQEHHVKLINMGDDLQLPPVMEDISPSFTLFEVLRLEKNMRQEEGSDILTVNGTLRAAMMSEKPFKSQSIQGDSITEIRAADFLKTVLDNFDLNTDLDRHRVLAWTNRRVNNINDAIRTKLFGKDASPYIKGERIVTGGPIKNSEGDIVLGTDEECIVHDARISTVLDEETGEEYQTHMLVLHPIHAEVDQVIAHVLHEDEQERYRERVSDLAEDAKANYQDRRRLWAKFWAFKELFSDIRYCYCITVHRAQGSTFDRVFVDVKDILGNKKRSERQRLLYVAYSRPRHSLLINKAQFVA